MQEKQESYMHPQAHCGQHVEAIAENHIKTFHQQDQRNLWSSSYAKHKGKYSCTATRTAR